MAYQTAHHVTSSQLRSQTTWSDDVLPRRTIPGAGFLFIHDITNTASGMRRWSC